MGSFLFSLIFDIALYYLWYRLGRSHAKRGVAQSKLLMAHASVAFGEMAQVMRQNNQEQFFDFEIRTGGRSISFVSEEKFSLVLFCKDEFEGEELLIFLDHNEPDNEGGVFTGQLVTNLPGRFCLWFGRSRHKPRISITVTPLSSGDGHEGGTQVRQPA